MAQDLAERIAARLRDEWSIGDFSPFCDEAANFDHASQEEIAQVIREVIASHSEVLQTLQDSA